MEFTDLPHRQYGPKDPWILEGMAQCPLFFAAAELGICIRKPGRNKGHGPGTPQLVAVHAFNARTSPLVDLRAIASRLHARQSDEGAGFLNGGTMRRAVFQSGRHVQMNIMGILRPQLHDSPEGQ